MNPKFQRILFKFLCLSAIFTMASCKDKEEVTNSFLYDIQLPAPLLEIADIYAEYIDEQGELHKELLPDGKFKKDFVYIFEEDEVYRYNWNITSVKITAQLKVDPSQLQEGAMLMKDPNAHYNLQMILKYKPEHGGYSKPVDLPLNVSVPEDVENYPYTVEEQMALFEDQDNYPIYSATVSGYLYHYDAEIHLNLGKESESETENEGLQIKKRINAIK